MEIAAPQGMEGSEREETTMEIRWPVISAKTYYVSSQSLYAELNGTDIVNLNCIIASYGMELKRY